MDFSDYSWQDCPDTGIRTGAYIVFYQGGPIYHGKMFQYQLPNQVQKMNTMQHTLQEWLQHILRMLIHEFLNKYPYIVPKESPLIILDIKSAVCMDKNGKDTNHTSKISRRMYLLRNGEKCKMHNIDQCEGGLQLADISTKNIGERDLPPRMKYIMVIIDN